MLTIGSELVLPASGRACRVRRLLGEGSQGVVFEAEVPGSGLLALKWYYAHTASSAQRRAIDDLVDRGAPSDRFLWPVEVVDQPPVVGFGYLMPLRPPQYVGLSELLAGKVDIPFSVATALCMQLSQSFLRLHSEGLCYRDISFGNVFFDPTTGQPLICDNDNVGIDGASSSAVLGTRRFMAPEIVRGEAQPSTQTDLYSLAVLLFYILVVGHPLVGRRELRFDCWDNEAENFLFGSDPLFVFDPDDDSNAPHPELHASVLANWPLYPRFVRELFTTAFTRGVRDPRNGRVREGVWRKAMSQLRDAIVECPVCERENLWDEPGPERPRGADGTGPERPRGADGTVAIECWACDASIDSPVRLRFDGSYLVLNRHTRVYRHHLERDYDFGAVVAEVVQHPSRPGVWGLRNASDRQWRVSPPGGSTYEIGPGQTVALIPETIIDLGAARATIVA
jgi:serine/threonine protein kinase